jgi:membrane protease YdiL (CAAX protease family)
MSTGSMALATSVPALAAGAFMIGLNAVLRPGDVRELGLAPRGAARGILRGLVGSAIAVPLIFFVAQVTEYIWEFFHYAHPREHDLLKLMGESTNPVVFALFVLSAVLIAPVFEELLFRGHLQTVIAYAIARGLGQIPGPAARGFQVVTGEPDVAPSMAEPVPAPVPSSPPASTRWAAILVTSLLFAAVHPAWTWPPILILALCLGYAYERTGNLWTSMTMHAMFNTTSTVIYLLFVR